MIERNRSARAKLPIRALAPSSALPLASALVVRRPPGILHRRQLANGLSVCVLENRQSPVVTSALFYRAGTRDEPEGQGGIAHFLEHLMFKGSKLYGPGEIDRRTQALGGVNNAFTSHDATAYYFDFAPDRWSEALAIEADRMAGLTLDPKEVASERQVVLEEIAMYEGDPWDSLELGVHQAFFGEHPYGRPVLGTREELATMSPEILASFHARFYQPANAVLVVAGDVGPEALEVVERAFGDLPAHPPEPRRFGAPEPAACGCRRLERHHGDVARLMMALPAPAGTSAEHPALRLAVGVLGAGRASRLHRALVDEGQLCSWVSVDLGEGLEPGMVSIAAEAVPGVSPSEVEELIFAELARLRNEEPSAAELDRARRIVLADWVFGHERVHHQALSAGMALTLFDLEHPYRQLDRLLTVRAAEITAAASRYLDPQRRAVVGWSLPAENTEGLAAGAGPA